ncbi:MAG: recombinase family protein [Proteobacteria bacterium]|nr:recombinase family protein [Pseudomonadota bacterium]MBU1542433.1 recombinase family protein [Pseudomonadota bacterium]MBU2482809.1 recombinase family protein [Pseudomonadota bacterium]
MSEIGYIRVSSIGQNDDRQLEGVVLDKIFREKISGKSIKRPELEKCLDYIREGDTLHVHSMDRLARNLKDLQNIVDDLTGAGVTVNFHKENLVFGGKADAMSKLLLQVMGAFAEFERSLIKERQLEGIAAAKKKGKHLGRSPSLSEKQQSEAVSMIESGKSKTKVAKHFQISRSTLYNLLKQNAIKSDLKS